ncbi:MAG TPA: amino acid deaminase/aldolase [Solirubrobacteraceae bacterium]|jgi:D-serine deaminase-like pyridoxal phosphate-dependent protein|nr:amino acid deaminase/aldolase [Solirubrobacteraceae bacterium]
MTGLLARLERATADLQPPFAVVDMDALWRNAADMERRAGGKPIRLASKSLRCRALQERVLARPGLRGTLAFTLPEALWLCEQGFEDIVVAYPTADREALRALSLRAERGPGRVAVMVDSVAQLDLIEAALASGVERADGRTGASGDSGVGAFGPPIEVCIDLDAGLWLLDGRIKAGAKRSPVRSPEQAAALAREIVARRRLKLVGMMAYEAQIAGVGDAPPGRRLRAAAIRALQRRSARELAPRRAAAAEAVEAVLSAAGRPPLRFVNGGGTGSLHLTAAEPAVTEIAAGSGLYGPALFDAYRAFAPEPAALFALPVVRKPAPDVATVLGGGYPASGPADAARLPQPFLPAGLALDSQEGAGEVQTPLLGAAARDLSVGDRVWFRHAKAGELCERFDRLYLIEGDRVIEEVPTYRGEGKCFL